MNTRSSRERNDEQAYRDKNENRNANTGERMWHRKNRRRFVAERLGTPHTNAKSNHQLTTQTDRQTNRQTDRQTDTKCVLNAAFIRRATDRVAAKVEVKIFESKDG